MKRIVTRLLGATLATACCAMHCTDAFAVDADAPASPVTSPATEPATSPATAPTTIPASMPTIAPAAMPTTLPSTRPAARVVVREPHIKPSDVASQAQTESIGLRATENDIRNDHVLPAIQDQLQGIVPELDARLDETNRLLEASPSLQTLRELDLDWSTTGDELVAWKKALEQRRAHLSDESNRLASREELWHNTADAMRQYRLPPDRLEPVDRVIAAVVATRDHVDSALKDVWQVRGAVDTQNARVIDILDSVQTARAQALDRLFTRDQRPIWSTLAGARDTQDIARQGEVSLLTQFRGLGAYAWRWRTRFAAQGALWIALAIQLYWVRRRTRSWAKDDPNLTHATPAFDVPLATAAVLALLVSGWMYPQAPRLLWAIIGAAALVPTVIVLRRLMDRRLLGVLNALVIFYFIDQLRVVAASLPILGRLMFLAEMAGATIFLALIVRRSRLEHQQGDTKPLTAVGSATGAPTTTEAPNRVRRTAHVAIRCAIVAFAVAFVADAAGWVSFANLVGNATLTSAYLAIILYATVRIVDGLMLIALRSRPLTYLEMVRRHHLGIHERVVRALEWTACAVWGVGTLELFALRTPVWARVKVVFQHELTYGSFHLTLSHVLVFALTVWASVLLSRFIRFVLEEDVYGRYQLAGGMPYAVSRVVHYVILLVGFCVAVSALGYDMTKFTILASAFTVGIGFGLQNIVNNFVSGLILLFERPVRVGDLVQLGDTSGIVSRIGIRASVIRTPDAADIIVPNGNLIANQVVNWTFSNRQRGIVIPLSVAATADPARVIDLLKRTAAAHPLIAAAPAPEAFFTKFGADSFGFELRAFATRAEDWVEIRSDLAVAINKALVRENIAIK